MVNERMTAEDKPVTGSSVEQIVEHCFLYAATSHRRSNTAAVVRNAEGILR